MQVLQKLKLINQARRKERPDSQSPYRSWLEATQEHDLQSPKVFFNTIGLAPVDAPLHPVRTDLQRATSDKSNADEKNGAKDAIRKDTCASEELSSFDFPKVFRKLLGEQVKIEPMNILRAFDVCDFFKPCSKRFLAMLVARGGKESQFGISLSPGEIVYEQGQKGSSMFIITRGTATVRVIHGLKEEVKDISIGDSFGELQMLGIASQRQETVCAKKCLRLYEIREDVFKSLLKATTDEEEEAANDEENTIAENPRRRSVVQRMHTPKVKEMLFPEERRHYEHVAVGFYRSLRPTQNHSVRTHARPAFFITACGEEEEPGLGGSRVHDIPMSFEKTQARCRYVNRLMASLRADTHHGYMVPSGCQKRNMSFASKHSAAATADATGERELEYVIDNLLDVDYVPPLESLSSLQKRHLVQKIQEDLLCEVHVSKKKRRQLRASAQLLAMNWKQPQTNPRWRRNAEFSNIAPS